MKTAKVKTRKDSDTDKAITALTVRSAQRNKNEIPRNISLDTILSEKDEVKNAEERLRQKTNKV